MKHFHLLLIAVCIGIFSVDANANPPDPIADARALIRENKFDQAAQQIEAYLKSNRFDGRAWSALGTCYHMQKDFDRARPAHQRALELGVNPSGEMYNIACGFALQGKSDDAIAWLKKSLAAGFTEQETLEKDSDMHSLRADSRFFELTGLNPPSESSPEKRWAYDLDFLVRRMEWMHWDLYAKVSKETFATEIGKLQADAPNLTPERIKVRLATIIATVGDGHTTVSAFAENEDRVERIPLHLYQFTDGLYVIGAPEAHRDLAGAKVLKIGALSANDALQRVRPFISVDNDMGYLDVAPMKLNHLAALQEIGAVADDKAEIEYALQFRDGSTRTVKLSPVSVTKKELRSAGFHRPAFVYVNQSATAPRPLYLEHDAKSLWFKSLDEHRAIYFGFNAVDDNDDQSFADFIAALTKEIEAKKAEYLIIDMRLNSGGNTGLVLPLLHALIKNDRITKPGHLFVIIGRNTFSAAQNTVNMIELHTPATFVGEPTGSRPNFVGESTYIILPYSKLRVYCSSRYWQHVVSLDKRTWVQPQIAAELSSEDFAQNRDPCVDAILKRIGEMK